jgi:hypothetical protein
MKAMFGILNPVEIEQLLSKQLVGRIGCHADGVTYVVPISYAYDGEYVYARTFEGMKINMMRKTRMSVSKWRIRKTCQTGEQWLPGVLLKNCLGAISEKKLLVCLHAENSL